MKKIRNILFAALFAITPLAVCAQTANTHIVQRGETFALVAKRYGLTEQELKKANPNEEVCYAGMKLKIPAKPAPKATTSSTSTYSTQSTASVQQPGQNYSAGTTKTPIKKKKSFWKKLGAGALVVAGVAAGVAVGVAASKAGSSGTGISGGNSGTTGSSGISSGSSGSTRAVCHICHGKKKCDSCNGSGISKYAQPGSGNKTCGTCRGSGKCFNCYGTGYQ